LTECLTSSDHFCAPSPQKAEAAAAAERARVERECAGLAQERARAEALATEARFPPPGCGARRLLLLQECVIVLLVCCFAVAATAAALRHVKAAAPACQRCPYREWPLTRPAPLPAQAAQARTALAAERARAEAEAEAIIAEARARAEAEAASVVAEARARAEETGAAARAAAEALQAACPSLRGKRFRATTSFIRHKASRALFINLAPPSTSEITF